MDTPNIRALIKAGFHFGHRTSRWNPKMAPYIFKQRNLIHIIDLRATVRGLITGRMLAQAVAARGSYVLSVGTKKQAAEPIARESTRCGMPYVAERWLGGLLTNYVTIRTRLDRLVELEDLEETGQIDLYSKKMVSSLRREKRKIVRNLGGVRGMDELPGLLVMVDPAREGIAVKEACKLGIPIVALTDTDGSPDDVDVVVPGNDDSFGAIDIFLGAMAEGVLKGLKDGGVVRNIEAVPEAAPPATAPEATPAATPEPTPEAEAEKVVPAPVVEEPAAAVEEPVAEEPAAAVEEPAAAEEEPAAAVEEPAAEEPVAAEEEPAAAEEEPATAEEPVAEAETAAEPDAQEETA